MFMGRSFLDEWVNQDEEVQVALLSAPIMFPPTPSAALSIFKSELGRAGISSKVIYAMFPMIQMVSEAVPKARKRMLSAGNAEYLFAHLTDVPASVPIDALIRIFSPANMPSEAVEDAREKLLPIMSVVEEIVEATARRIVHMGAGVVAASSAHRQQMASLAILKRVKELNPQIRTILGGYNVSGEMGLTVLRNFPSVDYISFGEGDETIAEVCSKLLAGEDGPMPYGVVGRGGPCPETAPFRMTKDMDGIAFPDYGDYFEEVQMLRDGFYGDSPVYSALSYRDNVYLEGSRGCQWGERRPCSFCSMNGLTNVYREKTPERFYDEIREAESRYPGARIHLCDNMLSRRMIRELLPRLAEDGETHSLFTEIRANLKSKEVRALSEAGFNFVQPGIESLNDHLLTCMHKGSTGVQNVALLKYFATFNVFPTWSLLYRFPGEKREDYEQTMDVMQLIPHLHPAKRVIPIAIMRFSAYGDHPQDYGMEIRPDPVCRSCFADMPDIAENIGAYYELVGGPFADTVRENQDLYGRLDRAVKSWNKLFYSAKAPELIMAETESGISIHDTRPCAQEEDCLLTGAVAEVYRLAWEPASPASLQKHLPESSEEEVQGILDDLVGRKLMLFLSGKYLALAVPKSGS